jgi:peptide deformylase
MSVLPLVQISKHDMSKRDSPLRAPSEEVTDFGEEFQKIVEDLVETFMQHKIAIGLAAPQVGIQLKLAVINLSKDRTEPPLILVNQKVLSTRGKKDKKKESCMSLPHYAGEVERRQKIHLSYQDRFGSDKTLQAEGFLARVVAHETDHLEGFLYVDRMIDLSKLEATDIFAQD